ncbi:hypothetical protein, partial [Aquipseudomonas alcaligenes]|uniref:hypothetical protein n=1 Tax=Aquipseudomonas alcaligenes TaxID=43263 RepID=UPI001C8138E4
MTMTPMTTIFGHRITASTPAKALACSIVALSALTAGSAVGADAAKPKNSAYPQIEYAPEFNAKGELVQPNVINLSCSPAQGKPPEAASRHGRRAMTRPLPLNQA